MSLKETPLDFDPCQNVFVCLLMFKSFHTPLSKGKLEKRKLNHSCAEGRGGGEGQREREEGERERERNGKLICLVS